MPEGVQARKRHHPFTMNLEVCLLKDVAVIPSIE